MGTRMHSSIFYHLMSHLNSFALSHVKAIIKNLKTLQFLVVKFNNVFHFLQLPYILTTYNFANGRENKSDIGTKNNG